ncbi:coproporphyrinogen-III oxidase family protein [Myxococcus sp. MxC21-1]|uniref:coproporphyrinogen-III oxidase family protein n=1 Tax=Myxococcus sp. MxC21-1 TaxID=3041439 RepID=UPI0029315C77|nr:coproporphyrinogen-III oxidase family protein [Myxococcus sp. MxC21-1]WNZ63405.1 coproporphyrinogen-III oxidase family protein [Myxococcus sp. MxC21-1]
MPFDAPVDALTGMPAARFGLYLHFPYCLAKCPYCDFAVAVARQVPEERYARAVLAELDTRLAAESLARGEGARLHLPGRWDAVPVAPALRGPGAGRHRREAAGGAGVEVSLEGNPERADAERFAGYRAAGVNRLSLGVQSFQPETLKALGRAHDAAMVEGAVDAARSAAFPVVAMDFIYGVHGQTVAQVEADARRAVALAPEHLSTYALTVERDVLAEDTPLSKRLKRGELELPPDDTVVDMARVVREVYGAAGLHRYEVSNHARPGFSSRHNALYWTGGEYRRWAWGPRACCCRPSRTGT